MTTEKQSRFTVITNNELAKKSNGWAANQSDIGQLYKSVL